MLPRELIEAKSNEAIYTDPKELEAKLTQKRSIPAGTSCTVHCKENGPELVVDGNEDDESISLRTPLKT